ncbi:hypothetical protein EF847_16600 [Actinobacteria bacterium YIM 96077]|uniref:Uncharacterized protein n=1 Tax=Phytoactinopolyspora halophila TaxID=1981511 RepID=A0A329QEU4_9ACTN|nr:hypothetical protein [Phytoactinopolyspora halophila]AYY14078.1 hypothetical protein EF847_16600 [Actinobacteria bacterium YIM 96077]RAW10985.1 hypothetical protein DPM12_17935 [Phytoactinopolyspora halophila]
MSPSAQQPTSPPETATSPPGGAPQGTPQGGGARPAAGAAVRPANPFAAIPIGDYVRDVLSVLFLLVPLGMAWDFEDQATGKVYVILVTLLSIISLSLPYLRAASVLPDTIRPAQQRLVRLLANVPYVAVVLVTLVLAYLGDGGGPGGAFGTGVDSGDGIGVGLVIGLAGVLMAAQGRSSEQDGAGDGALWRTVTLALAGVAVVLGLISAIIFLIDAGEFAEWSQIIVYVLVTLFFVGLPVLAVLGVMRHDAAWRDATVVLGVVGLIAAFWSLGAEETIGDVWSQRLMGPGFLVWPALAVAAAAPGLDVLIGRSGGAARWLGVPVRIFQLAIVTAVAGVAVFAFELIENEDARFPYITVLVLWLIALAVALVGRNALTADAQTGRPVAMGVAGALAVVGIVGAAVLGASDAAFIERFAATSISAWFVFAIAIALVLTTPKSVRDELGAFTVGQGSATAAAPAGQGTPGGVATHSEPRGATSSQAPAAAQAAESRAAAAQQDSATAQPDTGAGQTPDTGNDDDSTRVFPSEDPNMAEVEPELAEEPTAVPATEQQPSAPAAPEPEPVTASGYTASMAEDPNTPLQTLADIAAKEPSLRPHIAVNPATYPELVEWLGQLGDPAVDEALRKRGSA